MDEKSIICDSIDQFNVGDYVWINHEPYEHGQTRANTNYAYEIIRLLEVANQPGDKRCRVRVAFNVDRRAEPPIIITKSGMSTLVNINRLKKVDLIELIKMRQKLDEFIERVTIRRCGEVVVANPEV